MAEPIRARRTTALRACRAMSPSSWMATAAGRPSAGCRASEGHRRGVEALRRTVRAAAELGIVADDFLLQLGKLVAAGVGNQRSDGAVAPFHPQRPRRTAQEQRARAHHRRAQRARPRHRPAAAGSRRSDPRQQRADSGGGLQLRRPPGDRAAPRGCSRSGGERDGFRPTR